MREEQARLSNREPPKSGSFFRYELVEVREKLGTDSKVEAADERLLQAGQRAQQTAFAGRKPPAVPAGKSGYAGIELCSSCHFEEKQVWDRTGHARAYATLSKQFKEYNLDCVSCHVTGYEKAGRLDRYRQRSRCATYNARSVTVLARLMRNHRRSKGSSILRPRSGCA